MMVDKKYFKCVFIDEEDSFWGRFFYVGEVYLLKKITYGGDLVLQEHGVDCYHQVPAINFTEEMPLAYYDEHPIFSHDVNKFLDWFLLNEEKNRRVNIVVKGYADCLKKASDIIYNKT